MPPVFDFLKKVKNGIAFRDLCRNWRDRVARAGSPWAEVGDDRAIVEAAVDAEPDVRRL